MNTFGIETFDQNGNLISAFDKDYKRIVKTIRVEALQSGSSPIPQTETPVTFFFLMDEPVQRTGPLISVQNNVISWRPYATSPEFHTGGYIVVVIA